MTCLPVVITYTLTEVMSFTISLLINTAYKAHKLVVPNINEGATENFN